eukprot:1472954-Rhodomonas_salina.5
MTISQPRNNLATPINSQWKDYSPDGAKAIPTRIKFVITHMRDDGESSDPHHESSRKACRGPGQPSHRENLKLVCPCISGEGADMKMCCRTGIDGCAGEVGCMSSRARV